MKKGQIMRKTRLNGKGFTLIEIIVVLALVGITSVLAGMWIISVVNGYIFTKLNAETAQKGQLAMTRLSREFTIIKSITSSSDTQITYIRTDPELKTAGPFTVKLTDDLLQLKTSDGDYTLADNVSAFTLEYCDSLDSLDPLDSSWLPTSRIIKFKITLKGANNVESEFVRHVVPRNL